VKREKQTSSSSKESPEKGERKVSKASTPKDLAPSHFVSATYDGKRRLACIKLYEPESQRIYLWYDSSGHMPYCLTNLPVGELEKTSAN